MKMAAEQPQDKYVLRLPDGMRDRLKTAAAENNRSLNAEIVARLYLSFTFSPQMDAVQEKLLQFAERVNVLDLKEDQWDLELIQQGIAAIKILEIVAMQPDAIKEDISKSLQSAFSNDGSKRLAASLEDILRRIYNRREIGKRYLSLREVLEDLRQKLDLPGGDPNERP
jgi:hypothetical protein